MLEIHSRKVKGYLRLEAEESGLGRALGLAKSNKLAKLETLTGTQIAEAERLIREGNPYLAVVKVRTRERIEHAN